MELKISKNALCKLIDRVRPAISDKSPREIYKCILLKAEASGAISMTGTDDFCAISASATADVKRPGAVAVPSKVFSELAAKYPAADISIKVESNSLHMSVSKPRVTAKIPCLTGDDFPRVATPGKGPTIELPSKAFASLLAAASYAQSTDDTRPHMACTRLESSDGEVRAAATDGSRCAVSRLELAAADFAESIPGQHAKLIQRFCAELGKGSDDGTPVQVAVSTGGDLDGYMHFVWPGVTLAIKRGDNNFPPYQKVIPKGYKHRVRVPREDFIAAVKRALTAAEKTKTGTCYVEVDLIEGGLRVSAETAAAGESSTTLDVDYAGEEWLGAAGGELMVAALESIDDDDVLFCVSGPLDPYVFMGATDENCVTAVVMPMRRK